MPFFDSYYGYFTYYLAFFRGKVSVSYHVFLLLFVHLPHNIAWAKNNVNRHFLQKFRYDTYFANRDTRFSGCDTRFYVSRCLFLQNGTQCVPFLIRRNTSVIHIQVKVHTEGDCVYLYSNLSHFFTHA